MLITARNAPVNARKGRNVRTTRRPLTKLINSNTADSVTALRLQRLSLAGIVGSRADLIAGLAWGVAP